MDKMTIDKNSIEKHINECVEEGKEKAKITLNSFEEMYKVKQILDDLEYNDIYVYKRDNNNGYVTVVYNI
ncbi:hypothetical protein E4T78_11075 [Mammaliicoccus lentus]|nr:hypothetical protein E4T78_11075 [Mammaliicoccus lentus]